MFCPNCGNQIPEAKFCPICGHSFCKQVNLNDTTNLFSGDNTINLSDTPDYSPPPAEPVYVPPVYAQPEVVQPVYAQPEVAQPVYTPPVYAQPEVAPSDEPFMLPAEPAPKKKRRLIPIIAGITAAAVAIGAVAGWFFLGRKQTIYLRTAASFYESDGTLSKQVTYEYDKHGRLLEKETDIGEGSEYFDNSLGVYVYTPGEIDGTIEHRFAYEYDKHGNMTLYEEEHSSGSDYRYELEWEYEKKTPVSVEQENSGFSTKTKYELEYDDDGNLVKIRVPSNTTYSDAYTMEYDSEGRLTRELALYMEGAQIYEYAYDDDRLTEVSFYRWDYRNPDADQVLQNTTQFRYDSKGNLLTITRENSAGQETYHATYAYNSSGKLQSKEISGDEPFSFEFSYDGKKLSTAECGTDTYIYDKKGNLESIRHEDGSYVEYEYKKIRLNKTDASAYHLWEMREYGLSSTGSMRSYTIFHYLIPTPIYPELTNGPRTQ